MSLDVYLEFEVDTGGEKPKVLEVYWANITHNLGAMAKEAGIYEYLWRPEKCGVKTAGDLIKPLQDGVKLLEECPERFLPLNPENGWGSYEDFVPWVKSYLAACIENPKATVRASR